MWHYYHYNNYHILLVMSFNYMYLDYLVTEITIARGARYHKKSNQLKTKSLQTNVVEVSTCNLSHLLCVLETAARM
jgi:hypothetical protein